VAAAAEALGLVPAPAEDPYPSMPQIVAAKATPGEDAAPAEWLEPVAPMPADSRPARPSAPAPAPARARAPEPEPEPEVVEEEIVPDFEAADIASEVPVAEAEPMEFELEELDAEPAAAATEVDFEMEVAEEAAASTATKLDPEDSDWSLGSVIREDEPSAPAQPHDRNDDSFDLRSLALEVDEEPEAPVVRAAPAAPAPPAKQATTDEEDFDALFEEIQLED
jgi:hypothetical protein